MKILKCLIFNLFVVSQLNAQIDVGTYVNPSPRLQMADIDTISLARNIAYAKDFETADQLLTVYNAYHTEIHSLSLHAQILYWKKDFDRSIQLYEKGLRLFPSAYSLHLDYARVLFGLGKLPDAGKQLKIYQQFDTSNAEARIMTAYLDLWNGKVGLAGKEADQLLQKYPGNAEAKDIINTITSWTVPYIKAGTQFLSDDQPMKGQSYYAEAGVFKSWLFAPTISAAINKYKADDSSFHSSWIQLSNSFQFGTKNKLKLKGGIFGQNSKESEFTGGAEISRQIARQFSLQASVERRPSQFTISSIKNVVMENVSAVGLSYNRNGKWFGKAAYELFQYEDGNKINVAYLWLVAPIIVRSHFSFNAGYSFQYADALNSNYQSTRTLSDVVSTPPYEGLPGIYTPYFTPENQFAHNVLAWIKIIPSKKLQFVSRVSIGVFAKADNPYLYLDKKGGEFFINSGFAKTDYMPVSWVNELNLAASNKFSIAAFYAYDKLLYYKGNRGSIELKYLFSK